MVALSSSGEIFTLRAAAATDADGWARAAGRGEVTGDILAELSLCHGLTAAIGAEVAAEAEARLGALWFLAASGQVDASAQANAFARATFSGNVFDDFGAVLGVGAAASAAVAAQASAGLDAVGIARAAEAAFGGGLPLDLFTAFLNEVRIEGGARASASAGASAKAVIGLAGNLLEEPARFGVSVEAEATAAVGTGVEAFFLCEIADPRRMALTMSELAASEIAVLAREHLPEPQHVLVEWFELLAPVTTGIVWELAQETELSGLGPPEQLANRVVDAVLGRLQTMLFDRAVDAGFAQVADLLRDTANEVRLRGDDAVRLALADAVGVLSDGLPDRNLSLAEIGDVAGELLNIFDQFADTEPSRTLRRPLALMWTAAGAAIALRDPGATSSAEMRVVGAGQVAGAAAVQLTVPPPPDWVRAEWAVVLGRPVTGEVSFAVCVDALVALGVTRALDDNPALMALLDDVGRALDLTAGELVHTVIALERGSDLRGTPVYHSVREMLGTAVDELVIGRFLPLLQGALPAGAPATQWLEEAAVPSLLGVREFVLGRVDSLVGGAVDRDLSGFLNELRTALGVLGGKVVVRNLLVLQWILEDHVRATVPSQLRTLAGVIDSGALPPGLSQATVAWRQVAAQLAPPVGVDPVLMTAASRRLFGGLVSLAADLLEVEPAARRNRRRAAQAEAVRVADLTVDYGSADEVLSLVRSVMDCNGLPDAGAAAEFAVLQVQTLADQVAVAVTGAAPLLQRFFEDISAPALQQLADGFGAFVNGLERGRQQAILVVRVLDRIVREAAEDVADAARRLSAHLDELRRLLRSSALRAEALERIRTGARANAISVGGDAAGVAFDGVWAVAAFLVDPALDVLGAAAGLLSTLLDDVASGAEAVSALSAALSERVIDAMVGTDLHDLADFLGVDDLARWVSDVVTRGAVHAELAAAGAARRDQRQAGSRRAAAEQSRADARADRRSAELRLAGVSRNRVRPRIIEPAALRLGLTVVHEGTVTLQVQLPGGDARLLGTGEARRLDVRLNGRVLKLTPAHLHVAPKRCDLVRPLTSTDGLRPGINVVECTVLAAGSPLIDRVAFAWVPGVRPPRKGLTVDMAQCLFHVSGNDHLAPEDEYVCLVNEGPERIDLTGWRVSDHAGHVYVFDSGQLAPGRRVRLHSGTGADTTTRRFWGRQGAVWNNPWEAVVLVAPSGSVRAVVTPGGAP